MVFVTIIRNLQN